jgi:hypothetical protein
MLGKGAEHAPFLNAFLPQGVNIATKSDGTALADLATRALPIRNDMSRLLDDLVQQGHVLFSPSHLTSQAETSAGWTQAQALKDQVDQAAIAAGHRQGIKAVMGAQPGDTLYNLKSQYEQQRLDIAKKYPAWQGSIDLAVTRRLQAERELKQRATGMVANGSAVIGRGGTIRFTGSQPNPGDYGLGTFYNLDRGLRAQLTRHGVSIDDHPEHVSGDMYQAMREAAIELAQQDPAFLKDYQRFFQRTYGPIQRTI